MTIQWNGNGMTDAYSHRSLDVDLWPSGEGDKRARKTVILWSKRSLTTPTHLSPLITPRLACSLPATAAGPSWTFSTPPSIRYSSCHLHRRPSAQPPTSFPRHSSPLHPIHAPSRTWKQGQPSHIESACLPACYLLLPAFATATHTRAKTHRPDIISTPSLGCKDGLPRHRHWSLRSILSLPHSPATYSCISTSLSNQPRIANFHLRQLSTPLTRDDDDT